jgi:hypothetical protein
VPTREQIAAIHAQARKAIAVIFELSGLGEPESEEAADVMIALKAWSERSDHRDSLEHAERVKFEIVKNRNQRKRDAERRIVAARTANVITPPPPMWAQTAMRHHQLSGSWHWGGIYYGCERTWPETYMEGPSPSHTPVKVNGVWEWVLNAAP